MLKQYFIYILTNKTHTVLYTGVTNDLQRRVAEHKGKAVAGFTERYDATKLVYYERFPDIRSALLREKQIKAAPVKGKSS